MCSPTGEKVNIKSSKKNFSFRACSIGVKAEKLLRDAELLRNLEDSNCANIAATSEWTPPERKDYTAVRAIHTSCSLLSTAMHEGTEFYRRGLDEKDDCDALSETLVQLNFVRIMEPGPNEEVTTKSGSRLFVPVRLLDATGSSQVRMREDIALELTGMSDKDEFLKSVQDGDISFPMFASVRILIRPQKNSKSNPSGAAEHAGDEGNDLLSAIIVAAEDQRLDVEGVPNKAYCDFNPLHVLLPKPTDRMLIASLQEVRLSPHAGLVVGEENTPCEFVLCMIATKQKSTLETFGTGHRVRTTNLSATNLLAAAESADEVCAGSLTSVCTLKNLTDFLLSPPKPGHPQYALVLISSMTEKGPTYTVDKVQPLNGDVVADFRTMMRKLYHISRSLKFEGTPKRPVQWPSTPYTGRKTRRLSASPTADHLDDGL